MRITYLHQYFTTPSMIGGTRSYEFGRRLVAMGHEVHVVTSWREPRDDEAWFTTNEAGMTIHWLPVPYSNAMGFAERLRAFVRFALAATRRTVAVHADVVFATSTPLTIAIPAIVASRWTRRPMVFEVRDSWPKVPIELGFLSNPVLRYSASALEWFAYHASRHVIALAPAMKDDVVARGYPAERVSVIPNGCDHDLIRSGDAQRLHQDYPWISDRPVLVYVGAIGKMNGVGYVVELAEALRAHGDPFTFVIVGDGSERCSIESLAADRGVLGDTVQFIGSVPKTEVPDWLAAARGALMTLDGPPSIAKYTVQNKFFDALAAGVPVVANLRGFATEIAELAGAGVILGSDVPRAAADLAERWRSGWFERAATAAARLGIERFSRDEQAVELERILASAARGRT